MNKIINNILENYQRPEILSGILLIIIIMSIELIVYFGYIDTIILQRPSGVFKQLLVSVQSPEVRTDISVTAYRVTITFATSIVVALLISMIFIMYPLLRRAYLPLLGAVFGTPIILLYLPVVAIFGRSSLSIILISVPLGVIPVVINTTQALSSVEQTYIDVGNSFNANRTQMGLKVILPAAAPGIFAGIRMGFSYIVISVTAVEFLLVMDRGLGGWISDMYFRFQTSEMLVGITFIVLIVVLAIFAIRQLEKVISK